MALENGNGNGLIMPVAPMGYGYGSGFGGGFGNGWGGDGWWVILFLFALMGNGGWGGFGGFGGGFGNEALLFPYLYNQTTQNEVSRGFDNSAVTTQLNGIQSAINSGFASSEVANCNRAMDAMQTAYTNQIADLNRSFSAQTAIDNRLDTIDMALQNCCCENRASIADLKYTVATEACADRAAVNDALRDVLTANTANTQRILDQMCQDKIDAKNERITELQNQLYFANLQASQTAQTARLLSDNAAQTQQIENYIRPQINPAYIVPNPYASYGFNGGYGCGCNGYGVA